MQINGSASIFKGKFSVLTRRRGGMSMKRSSIVVVLFLAAMFEFGQGGATIKYVSWMAAGEDRPTLANFMKANPGIVVEDEILEGSKYQLLLKTRILGGDIPDVMMIMPDQVQEFIRLGIVADLSNEEAVTLQKESPSINAAFSKNGKTYAFTVNGGTAEHPIWYNKVIFRKLGISEPTSPVEFLSACEKIKAAGFDPVAFGAKDSWPNRWASYWNLTSQVKIAIEKAKTKDVFEAMSMGVKPSELYAESFAFIEQAVAKGYISKASSSMTWPESAQYFVDGKAAMLPQGPWVPGLDSVKAADPSVFQLGVFLFPAEPYNGARYLRAAADRILVVSAKSKNPAAAKKLFNYFASEANLRSYLSEQALTSLLPIKLDLPPILDKYVADTQAKGIEIGFHDISFAPPGFEAKLCEIIDSLFAGESSGKALAEFDAWYADHKKDMKR
jgi:raffinose/stachyose/melibiose transport system substrate-binding protein